MISFVKKRHAARQESHKLISLVHSGLPVGSEDRICPPDGARALRAGLPRAQLRELAGVGHDPSHPSMVNAMVRALDAFAAHGSFDDDARSAWREG